MTDFPTPRLITFDGEARSGKGTIVQFTKDYLRDELGRKVMLIDRGQTFRTLVVAAARAGIDLDNAGAIDVYLSDPANIADCVQFVKDVYHMPKDQRDSLLYTNEVGENSAKIGARPASQTFVANLTKKWLHDAGQEGFEIVLIDGRALEAIAREMDDEKLCQYVLGLYFVCDHSVGARRTLGYASIAYDQLGDTQRSEVDELMDQIEVRNQRDANRDVERLVRPDAPWLTIPGLEGADTIDADRPMAIIDTSAEVNKVEMSLPVAKLVTQYI